EDRATVRLQKTAIARLLSAVEAAMKFIVQINAQKFIDADGSVDKDQLEQALRAAMEQATALIERATKERNREIEQVRAQATRLLEALERVKKDAVAKIDVTVTHNEPFTGQAPFAERPEPPRVIAGPSDAQVGSGGLRRILISLAQRPKGLT